MTLPRPLTHIEARVLATLMEKARTVPDTYPLTLNALLAGCNQKSSRAPVMQLAEREVLEALQALHDMGLVAESQGQRASRWSHNAIRTLGVPEQAAALLGLLMLRGPQTAAELRQNAARWHRFADSGAVESFLNELAERSEDKGGPLAALLPRAPGMREARWTHLLCEPVDAVAPQASASAPLDAHAADGSSLAQRVTALEAQTAALRAALEEMRAALGMSALSSLDDREE